jgi:hypothetical protein
MKRGSIVSIPDDGLLALGRAEMAELHEGGA